MFQQIKQNPLGLISIMQPLVNLTNLSNPNNPLSAYWEGFFTEDELKIIENLPNWKDQHKAFIYDGELKIKESQRISDVSWLYLNDETNFIYQKIGEVIDEVNRQFFQFDLSGLHERIQLGLYDAKENGHYDWHIDCIPNGVPRKLSFSMLLSDPSEFEGGQFEVKLASNDPEILEQKRGRAWLFPSTFLHRVSPVTKGIRKSLVVWAGGPAFR